MAKIGSNAYLLKYERAVARLPKTADPLERAHTIRHLGDAYYYAKQLKKAEPCYVEALSIYRRHENRRPLDLANAIRSFAVLKDEFGETEEARRSWQEAHDIYVTVKVSAGVAESAARLALLAKRRGELKESRDWLSKAISAADMTDDPEPVAYVRKVKAQLSIIL